MRTFLAFEIGEEVQETVLLMNDRFRGIDRSVRWVKSENTHVTIHFFGEVEGKDIPEMESSIGNVVQGISPFDVEVRGISAFPSLERARVIWYGIYNHAQLQKVYNDVSVGLQGKNIVEKLETRPYTPHITAGRVKGRMNTLLVEEIKLHENKTFGIFTVSELILFKSTLTNRGPIHEKLSILNL